MRKQRKRFVEGAQHNESPSIVLPEPQPSISEPEPPPRETVLPEELPALSVANRENWKDWLWGLRSPLLLLGAIALAPKMILLWIFIVIAKPVSLWAYNHCPQGLKDKLKFSLPTPLKNSPLLRDFNEGADQGLPFILFWLYLCCAPFAISWIAIHWIKGFLPSEGIKSQGDNVLVFEQNKKGDRQSENNFYHSQAFGIVFLAFFALGIPAFLSYSIYERLGIEQLVQSSPTHRAAIVHDAVPQPIVVPKMGLVNSPRPASGIASAATEPKAPTGAEATVVTSYGGYWPLTSTYGINPNKFNMFFVHFYLVSLASALCVLFFRAWLQFPLNFLADEHQLEVTALGIRRKSLKGWFLSVITINRWATGGGPDALTWSDIKSLRRTEEGFVKLHPLPETAFKRESLSYKLLNKCAAFMDGISKRSDAGNYLVFSTTEKGNDFGRNIKLSLKGLNREQRARLFYAVRKWAPHVVVQNTAEEQLIGSTVLKDVRYTQLWFDMLTSRSSVSRKSTLLTGETLHGGAYTVDERISSGGQATTYAATKASGEKCVLKEFILSTASTAGALVESAREFESEVSLLSQLSHPGIVRLEDFFSEDGRVYVALEYINGRTLRQLVQECGPFKEDEVVRIGRSICEILQYLHNSNPPIVHRDLTPENILVQADGAVRVVDFSLAIKQDQQQTTNSCAKQAFTPPEQFREEICAQSDIYALGATMHFMITGLTPKPISVSSPRSKFPQVSNELNRIIERATQLDLNQRYESAHWMKLDLDGMADDLVKGIHDEIETYRGA